MVLISFIIIDQSIQDELFLDFDFYLFEQWAIMFHYNVLISKTRRVAFSTMNSLNSVMGRYQYACETVL
jgi:hypothetical protein